MAFGAVPVKTWSYSKIKSFELCPLKYRLQYLDGIKEPPSKAMLRGSAIHKLAENYVNGELELLPPELLKFKDEFEQLRARQYVTEQQVALDRNWQPTEWVGEHTWLRGVIDANRVLLSPEVDDPAAIVLDYKTGRNRPENQSQLGLYAAVMFSLRPDLVRVDAELWYLDSGEVDSRCFVASDIPTIKQVWTTRVNKMLDCEEFTPTPNGLCDWCFYRQEKHGDCSVR